jgi:hypothetical protein
MKATIFGAKEEHGDDNITNINMQQNNKGEEVKVLCVCVCVCVFGFVLCWVLFYTFLSRLESFLSQRIWLLFTN